MLQIISFWYIFLYAAFREHMSFEEYNNKKRNQCMITYMTPIPRDQEDLQGGRGRNPRWLLIASMDFIRWESEVNVFKTKTDRNTWCILICQEGYLLSLMWLKDKIINI